MEMSKTRVHQYIKETLVELKEERKKLGNDIIDIELKRLDDLLKAISEDALKGDLGAIDRTLKIQERRSKYLGLDQPSEHKHSGEIGIEQLVAGVQRKKKE